MAIDRNFGERPLKAVASLEVEGTGLRIPYVAGLSEEKLMKKAGKLRRRAAFLHRRGFSPEYRGCRRNLPAGPESTAGF